MSLSDKIDALLADWPVPDGRLPVIVMTGGEVRLLGDAANHSQAETLGLAARISFGRISRAGVGTSGRKFFALRP